MTCGRSPTGRPRDTTRSFHQLVPTPCDVLPYDKRLNVSEFPGILSAERDRVTYTSRSQVHLGHTPALNSEGVTELLLALALSLNRQVTDIDRRIRKGERIIRSQALRLSLFRKAVGIIGMGNIAEVQG